MYMKAVHEDREALVKLAPPGLGLIQPKVDTGVEIEQKVLEPDLPADLILAALEQVAQDSLSPWQGGVPNLLESF